MELPDLPVLSWVLAGIAVVIIGIAKSGFGGGVGIIAVPLFIYALDSPAKGVGTLLLLLIAADVFSVFHHFGRWDKKNLIRIGPGTLIGVAIGAVLMAYFTNPADPAIAAEANGANAERGLKLIIGAIAAAYPILELIKMRYASQWRIKPTWRSGTIAGLGAGIASTLAHAAGPVTSIYLLGQHMEKRRFIGTSVIYYFALNNVKLIPYIWLGLIQTDTFVFQLCLLPLIPVGTFLGVWMNKIVSESLFRGIIMTMIFLTGLQMLTGINPFSWLG